MRLPVTSALICVHMALFAAACGVKDLRASARLFCGLQIVPKREGHSFHHRAHEMGAMLGKINAEKYALGIDIPYGAAYP